MTNEERLERKKLFRKGRMQMRSMLADFERMTQKEIDEIKDDWFLVSLEELHIIWTGMKQEARDRLLIDYGMERVRFKNMFEVTKK
jgi:hypothetical protein